MKQSITINVYPAAPADTQPGQPVRTQRPPVRIHDPEFQRGYYSGLQEGLHGLAAGEPITDTEIIDILKEMHTDGVFSGSEDIATLRYCVGALLGRIIANM